MTPHKAIKIRIQLQNKFSHPRILEREQGITNGPYTISQAIVDMLLDNKLSFENDVRKIEVEIV